jgi:probable HAF family extracellular repeat protein
MVVARWFERFLPRRASRHGCPQRLTLEALEGRYLPSYAVADLGTLGGPASFAMGLNNAGQVVGYSYLNDGPETHAFLWQAGVLTDLGTLGGGRGSSRAFAVSDTGRVVGEASVRCGSAHRAVVWDAGVPTALGALGGRDSYGYAVNRSGLVVGAAGLPGTTPENHAFAARDRALRDLGTLGGFSSAAYGVSDAGVVVGESGVSGGTYHAFRYAAGALADLGTLPGYVSSSAGDVNDAGQVVGTAVDANGGQRAFLYSGGAMTDLGLPPRAVASGARAVNRAGEVVGFLGVPGPGGLSFHAFVYTDGKPADLNDLLPAGTGWELNYATAVNDRGQIAGWGVNPQGKLRSFLLTPGTDRRSDAIARFAAGRSGWSPSEGQTAEQPPYLAAAPPPPASQALPSCGTMAGPGPLPENGGSPRGRRVMRPAGDSDQRTPWRTGLVGGGDASEFRLSV